MKNANEALDLYEKHKPDLVISDIRMPGMSGLQMAEKLKQTDPKAKIIMMTAYTDTNYLLESIKLQVEGYIVKPLRKENLLSIIKKQADIVLAEKKIKEQELAIHQQNLQLLDHNEELDSFSHTVDHDLKTPLGNIMGFANLLHEDYPNLSKDEIENYITIIINCSKKIQQIINSLLLFASVRKSNIQTKELTMQNIVAEIINSLLPMIEKSNATITLPKIWPAAVGYISWVEEVWTNYLSNAIKYGGTPPQIGIGYNSDDSENQKKR